MILFPNCKINLGLYITSKRYDGYHNLETVFYPVPIIDALEVIEDKNPNPGGIQFSTSGLEIGGDFSNNLCVKAYYLLKKDFPGLPPVQMHLHKSIPMGAGLGGGSSDGAFTLLLLNQKFNMGLSESSLVEYALELGSDCPFFIVNKPCAAKGRGEILQVIDLDLKGYTLVLINPGIHISTREAFRSITPIQPAMDLISVVSEPVESWKESLQNDFEQGIFTIHPVLAEIKSALYHAGAIYAAMSGSGSTLYGLFKDNEIRLPAFSEKFLVKQVKL